MTLTVVTMETEGFHDLLMALDENYLIAEGLMASASNKVILEKVVTKINSLHDELMSKCLPLGESDVLPDSTKTNLSVKNDKVEFDGRVRAWIESAETLASDSERHSEKFNFQREDDCRSNASTCRSSRTHRSGSSVVSQKLKESVVKLRLATFAREMQYEQSRQAALAEKTLNQLNARQEEAEKDFKLAQAELKQAQAKLKQDALLRDKELGAQLAALEADAWKEAAKDHGSVVPKEVRSTSKVPNEMAFNTKVPEWTIFDVNRAAGGVGLERHRTESNPKVGPAFRARDSPEPSPRGMPPKPMPKPMPSSEVPDGGSHVLDHARGSTGQVTVGNGNVGAGVQDYPPPKPVIPSFEGDPLMFWTFIRSFDTHIASKMPNDAARLVYLLQHCSAKIRQGLDHFSRDNADGYRLARESLFNEYGQPHIIAFCCEQKLLKSPRLKSKEPDGLRDLAILMEKCLGVMQDIGDFATLNSFGTIQRITEKFSEEMQREWVRWAFRVLKDTGAQAKFRELVEFVRHEADEANSLYGRSFFSSMRSRTFTQMPRKSAALSAQVPLREGTRNEPVSGPLCPYCGKGRHALASCNGFKNIGRPKKMEFLRQQRRCFRCLEKGHMIDDCRSTQRCKTEGCDEPHHTLLHRFVSTSAGSSTQSGPEGVMCASVCGTTKHDGNRIPYFMTLPVKVTYGGTTVSTYVMLDSGSQRTFCDKSLAKCLGAEGPREVLPIKTLSSGSSSAVVDGMLISLSLTPLCRGEAIELRDVLTVDEIPMHAAPVPTALELEYMKHLRGVELHELEDKSVGLLIGLDNPALFRFLDGRYGCAGEPDAVLTALGWTLFGSSLSCVDNLGRCMHVACLSKFDTDVVDVAPHEDAASCGLDCASSREDRVAFELMKNSVKLVDGHFQLPLLWRKKGTSLPNNRIVAENRLESLRRRLEKDSWLHQHYTETMQTYLEKGYAEPVEDGCSGSGHSWFLPHHPVLSPNKPRKVRIVFDCASRCKGVSLNDELMQGPQLMNSLLGVLTRFRSEDIALVADIEAMFHQVRVEPEDRSALQFLWWPAGDLSREARVYRMAVHLFGATSSPSCAAFCLRRVAKVCNENCSSKTRDALTNAFYVDDCLTSVSSVEDAVQMIAELRLALAECGFNLTKWVSNSDAALASVPVECRAEGAKLLDLEGSLKEKVLGVQWEVVSDELCVKIKIPSKPFTRRGILSMSHSVFDPLGMVAPVLLEPKLLLRELCNHGWDDVIDSEKIERWQSWLSSLCHLEGLCIPRCFKPGGLDGAVECQLHYFADASELAYGAVAYLRVTDEHGQIHCSFVMGKSHLSPNPRTTIPRLELLAAVTAVRLHRTLQEELTLPISAFYFWVDSSAVLQSIHNSRKRFPVFLANRLAEAEKHTNVSDWRYVPSRLNPADEVSRGVPAKTFTRSSCWLTGPDFLLEPDSEWPKQLNNQFVLPEDSPMFERRVSAVVGAVLSPKEETELPMDRFINYFSSWHKLKVASVWFLRFITHLPDFKNAAEFHLPLKIGVDELKTAEMRLLSYDQSTHFPHLVKALRNGKELTNSVCPLSLKRLSPYMDGSVVRVGGRLADAPVGHDQRHPIILASESRLTELIIQHCHESVGHAGVGHTFTALRARYWIQRGSTAIKSVIKNCLSCRRNFRPCEQQMMSDLPAARLQIGQPPFFHTGVDLFGPFQVKQGRSVVKRYGCIFTCMTVRCMHLEVVHTLTTDSFISALRRFISRRGSVAHIHSDNGTNFVGADRILKESIREWNQRQIGGFLLQREVEWHFNTPLASHFGGAWERLIRSVRRVLSSLHSEATFSEEGLITLFAEVESIINSRPLTPISFVEDFDRPLTPNDLLVLNPDCGLPPMTNNVSGAFFPQRWRQVQHFSDLFWKRWVREYLPSLAPRQKWNDRRPNVCEGDVVILKGEDVPRSQWPLGKVVKTFPDSKGMVRSVLVKTKSGELKRPVTKLCVIVPKCTE